MQPKQPSLTARGVALHRAAHQILEKGAIFADPYAVAIVGEAPEAIAAQARAQPERAPLRLFVAARSRFAEDALEAAYRRGTRQAVVLGAGFDTFALRNAHADLRVFEADHPATQTWKRARLTEAGLAVPPTLVFVPVDFEHETLGPPLRAAGFALSAPAFFLWLGVVPYLTREAIATTLGFIASIPQGEVVFDYTEPLENYPPETRARAEALARHVAGAGEPFRSYFEPARLHADLRGLGFSGLEDLGGAALIARYLAPAKPAPKSRPGGHILRAWSSSGGR